VNWVVPWRARQKSTAGAPGDTCATRTRAVVSGGEPVTVPHAVASKHATSDFDSFSMSGIRSP
jgi:hypothetical protein